VGWSSFTVALGGGGVVPVFGWASWLVKEIVAHRLAEVFVLTPTENRARNAN
jgi:hypothetical protein